jgi:hypothetical protein
VAIFYSALQNSVLYMYAVEWKMLIVGRLKVNKKLTNSEVSASRLPFGATAISFQRQPLVDLCFFVYAMQSYEQLFASGSEVLNPSNDKS